MLLTIFSCRATLRQLDDYLDRELSPSEMRAVATHLRLCRACARRFAFERELIAQVRQSLDRAALPEELDALAGKISDALRESATDEAAS